MNFWKLLLRSLVFYRRIHLWVVLGTMVSTAILVGALLIGDSVRYSLQQIVYQRLGQTEFALSSGNRFFRTQIADNLRNTLQTPVAPLLQTKGIAIIEGGKQRLNNVQVIGVDARFGEIGGIQELYNDLSSNEAIINRHLAMRLRLKKEDEILLRIEKLDSMPKDIPLALDSESSFAKRFKVKAIASESGFGRFNLKAEQISPSNIFVSLSSLSHAMGFEERANVLLLSKGENEFLSLQVVNDALKKVWTLDDYGLEIVKNTEPDFLELRSNRIFLDPPVVKAAFGMNNNVQGILTYFVNEIRRGERSAPYSFVSAPGGPIIPSSLKDDEIIINEWLASDLRAREGDDIQLTYYRLGPTRALLEETSDFRIKAIVPLQDMYLDKNLMPDFPGLADEENCRDWHPGIPIDLGKIRDKDERYWDKYKGTPKAFVTLKAAQRMWENRFGSLTAIRFEDDDASEINNYLTREIDPADLGFSFHAVKAEGLRASANSVDFAQLFLGLSFFVIIAALMLTGLLFVFNVERRSEENGLFLALGFRRKEVRRIVLLEGTVLIILGSLLGSAIGIIYNQIILLALKTVWQGAVGTSALQLHLRFPTIAIGLSFGILIAFFTIWLVVGRQVKQTISGLQRGLPKLKTLGKKRLWPSILLSILCVLVVIILFVLGDIKSGEEAFSFFFMAGSLLLVSGLTFTYVLLLTLGKKAKAIKLKPFTIGVRNNVRRPVRSLTLIGLLACGLFIVFTVGANRKSSLRDYERRESGTGGFALYGESSIPILYDLNNDKGQQFYGLERISAGGVSYVQFRVKEGDDASCLNLNRVSSPQIIGVDPDELVNRGPFTFVEMTDDVDPARPWSVLDQELPDGSLPAIADQTVIVWGLGKSVGDSLSYLSESGEKIDIKLVGGLANSIFQGNIIISEKNFIQLFPSLSGYQLFLIDVPLEGMSDVSREISWVLQDQGLDLVSASSRLAEFNKVENTYLSIFLILGSFGLILGSLGLGIVVWRNIGERQNELALLRSVGFSKKSIQRIILSEHLPLLLAGIFLGVVAALIATLPSIVAPGSEIPFVTIAVLLIFVIANGGFCTLSATYLATRKDLIPALRNE